MAMTNKKLKNREYCRKYRQKDLEEVRKRDKERKKLKRDNRRFFHRDKYEEYKEKDRERKAAKKAKAFLLIHLQRQFHNHPLLSITA